MLLVYGLYVVISLALILLVNKPKRENSQTIVVQSIIVISLPVVGWAFILLRSKNKDEQSYREFTDYLDKQQREHNYYREGFNPIEKDRELSIIPLEEALVINNYSDRRKALIEVLKHDTLKYMEKLQYAISNEDTETSHYAVSAIMEIKSKLLSSMQELEVKYEEESDNPEIVQSYLEVLKRYLESGLLDKRTKRKYLFTYLAVIRNYLDNINVVEMYFEEKLRVEIELSLYSDAELTAKAFIEAFPTSEKAYLSLAKYYYTVKSESKFFDALNRLKSTPIKLSNEGITILRYWTKGVNDETGLKV